MPEERLVPSASMAGMTMIHGEVAAGFEPVREAFAANFARHGDVGAAVCVYQSGRPVVDLWGGVADPETGRPWTQDTLQLVYSATKGATATAVHMLVERGQLDLARRPGHVHHPRRRPRPRERGG